jgi:hypothetical protein
MVSNRKKYMREYIMRRYNADPEFRERMKERARRYIRRRYHTDAKFRIERMEYTKAWKLTHQDKVKGYYKKYRAKHKKARIVV